MVFEPTINIGNLVMIAMIAVTIIGGWYKFGGRLDIIEFRVKAIEDTLKALTDVLKAVANSDKQMALLDQRTLAVETALSTMGKEVADLRRGEGFIQAPRRGNVDGEYTRP
jgi:hypothetical protein